MDPRILRILDANLNRAREALRVIEDFARFALDDADAAESAKRARHELRQIMAGLGADGLLAARDILADVGRDCKTESERHRQTADDVVRAAFGRLSEAARTISEYAKLESPQAVDRAERIRYRAYELEQRIVLRGALRGRFRQAGLYVIVTEALCARDWLATAEAALRGGAGALQLREKDLPDRELLARARRLRELTRGHDALLIVNDRPDVARLSAADGVHLGQDDLAVHEARSIVGAHRLVGRSTHTVEQLEAAIAEDPDYLAVGPMFASSTKPQEQIAGPATMAKAAERTQLPRVAIGGVTADNAGQVLRAGAHVLCVCSDVISSPDVERASRRLVELVRSRVGADVRT
jgi:thiamine-phosphate pyrophosphorylase